MIKFIVITLAKSSQDRKAEQHLILQMWILRSKFAIICYQTKIIKKTICTSLAKASPVTKQKQKKKKKEKKVYALLRKKK